MPLTALRLLRSLRLPAAALCLALVGASAPAGAQEEPFRPLVQGEAPPDFALPDTSGRTVRLSDFRGRAILLTFVSCYTDTCLTVLTDLEPLVLSSAPRGWRRCRCASRSPRRSRRGVHRASQPLRRRADAT